ncbi:hypothetical protein DVS28_b0082 (plasmid) [Euzebya pacifica]|uniref:Uncharacterized protein n=1 Tax=Euzebya pacifica TaxID=1608957 RepID=A0A346Y5V5_9ACTN|nr:hypothetical protein [Euzebya pacifica]AXV09852.1 hypothetical protein DVS28_b0082 [Euzebya pacifica]
MPTTKTLRNGDIVRSTTPRPGGRHRRGVVTCDPLRPGDRVPWGSAIASVGDVVIRHDRASHTTTNMHDSWETIPVDETTPWERALSAAQTWTYDGTDDETTTPVYAWIEALAAPADRRRWTVDSAYPDGIEPLIEALAGTIGPDAADRVAATADYQPSLADLGDHQPDNDLRVFVRLEAIVPPEVRDTWEMDYPASVWELVVAVADWIGQR